MSTILVVDDEPQIAGIARDYLQLAGFEVILAGDGVRALEAARGRRPDLADLVIDAARMSVRRGDEPIDLTPTIGIESTPGQGTEVMVSLPRALHGIRAKLSP